MSLELTIVSLCPPCARHQGKAQLSGTTLAKDFGGLYGDGAEDAVIAPRPTCTGGEAALGEPEVFRMEVQKIGSNPLFYAERSRGREGTSNITASPTPVAPDRVFAASSCGESGGEAVEGVFCASRHSPGGSVARSSSETGGGPAVQTRYVPRASKNWPTRTKRLFEAEAIEKRDVGEFFFSYIGVRDSNWFTVNPPSLVQILSRT